MGDISGIARRAFNDATRKLSNFLTMVHHECDENGAPDEYAVIQTMVKSGLKGSLNRTARNVFAEMVETSLLVGSIIDELMREQLDSESIEVSTWEAAEAHLDALITLAVTRSSSEQSEEESWRHMVRVLNVGTVGLSAHARNLLFSRITATAVTRLMNSVVIPHPERRDLNGS